MTHHSATGPTALATNRSEVFYSATVLPLLIASRGFQGLPRFLGLCGAQDVTVDPDHLVFQTEYSLHKALAKASDKGDYTAFTELRTPDVVIAGSDWLVVVEVKVFHRTSAAAMATQLTQQHQAVTTIADRLGVAQERVWHVVLVPRQLRDSWGDQVPAHVVTWQEVHEAFRDTPETYWLVHVAAIEERYDELVSSMTEFGLNRDGLLSGSEILALYRQSSGDGPTSGPEYTYMGRQGGLKTLQSADVPTEAWRSRRYEVRKEPIESKNWFPIADFVALVEQQV